MLNIAEKYIVDKKNKKVAVQIPIDTYKKIESVLEDYALGQYILNTQDEKPLSVKEAKKYYGKSCDKTKGILTEIWNLHNCYNLLNVLIDYNNFLFWIDLTVIMLS